MKLHLVLSAFALSAAVPALANPPAEQQLPAPQDETAVTTAPVADPTQPTTQPAEQPAEGSADTPDAPAPAPERI
ncbi:MAG: hypothetical protein SNJ63_04940 [Sphingomonadaceae bacterium]